MLSPSTRNMPGQSFVRDVLQVLFDGGGCHEGFRWQI